MNPLHKSMKALPVLCGSWSTSSVFTLFQHLKRRSLVLDQHLVRSMMSTVKPRIFLTRRIPEKALAILASECSIDHWDKDDPPPYEDCKKRVKDVDGLYCLLTDKVDTELLDAAGPKLRVISTMSVGHDHIDLKECVKRKIKVGYTPGILTNATAELTVALLLATSRRLKEGMRAVENGEWGTWKPLWLCGPGLDGATVGIMGLGRIGLTVAKCLKPFGVSRFLYSGRSEKAGASEVGAKFVSFEDLLKESDFVIVCCALTPETKGLFNADAFRKMKKTSVLVNTSRGGVVNQEDLYDALKQGEIGAAGLDVTTPEPLPTNSQLLTLDNCVVLPHIGSATFDTREAMAVLAARNLVAGLKGESMPCQLEV